MKRYRISVPDEDTVVHRFFEAQNNISFSLRMVIRNFVARYGEVDATCVDLQNDVSRSESKSNTQEVSVSPKPEVRQPVVASADYSMPQIKTPSSVPMDNDGFVDPNDLL